MDIRETLKLIYKSLTILITLALGIGAVAAWYYSTPGNGLLLVSGILAILTLIVGLSIKKLEWQDQQAESYREILDEMKARIPVSISFSSSKGPGQQLGTTTGQGVSFQVAEPDVHRVDNDMLEAARRMAADGAPIDDICRMIDPAHDRNDPFHQEAFRKIVRTMIEQA